MTTDPAGATVPAGLTLPAMLGEHVRVGPGRPALVGTAGEVLAYEDIFRAMSTHQAVLRDFGVGRRDRVALVHPDGVTAAALSLVLAANAVCAPVSPLLRPPEIREALAGLHPRAVVVPTPDGPVAEIAKDLGIGVLTVRDVNDQGPRIVPVAQPGRIDGASDDGYDRPVRPEDPAFLLSTSGSTAKPKLVPLSHRNVLAAARATVNAYRLTTADRRLNFMALHHVQGIVGSVLASLVSGGSVVCLPGFNAMRVSGVVREYGVTWYSATPTMHRELIEADEEGLRMLTSHGLRFVRAGSAALPWSLRQRVERITRVPVVESYGMTEAHQIASTPLDPAEHRRGTVGRPTGAEVAIMVPGGDTLVGPGEPGEVVIRGDSVMCGYADDPSADAFTAGWFRTGDMGSLDADGFLTLGDRLKEIINRGGEKISPRQVDEVLLRHPGVAEAMAFAVPDARFGEEVGAVIVPHAGGQLDESTLREYLLARLAPFKTPRRIAFVDRIPTRIPGVKPRRKDLAELLGFTRDAAEPSPSDDAAAITAIEVSVAAIWREVLRIPEVGVDEDFFFLGGDSITGAQILTMIDEVFGVELSPFAMYDDANTVKGMARLITNAREQRRRGRAPEQ